MNIPYPPLGSQMCDLCINTTADVQFTFENYDGRFLCSACIDYLKSPLDKNILRKQWLEVMEQQRGKSEYDFLLAFSGGADSSAALKILRLEYNLRILAFTINNGMKNDLIWKNASSVTRHLGVDWLYIHDITRAGGAIVDQLRVGGHVCGSICEDGWKIPNYKRLMQIYRNDYVLTGLEIPTNGTIFSSSKPFMIKFMAAHMMPKKQVFEYISDLPWVNPGIRGFDTDCLGAGFGLELYRRKHQRHAPIVLEFLAPRIRYGLLDRNEELEKLNAPVPESDWIFLENQFGSIREKAT